MPSGAIVQNPKLTAVEKGFASRWSDDQPQKQTTAIAWLTAQITANPSLAAMISVDGKTISFWESGTKGTPPVSVFQANDVIYNHGALQPLYNLVGGTAIAVADAGNAVITVGQFLAKLTSGALWVRVGEFAVGAILLGVGLHQMTNGKSTASVKKATGALTATSHSAFQAPKNAKPVTRSSREHIQGVRRKEAMYRQQRILNAREAAKPKPKPSIKKSVIDLSE